MTIWLFTLALFLIAFTGMAIGVMFNREPIKGSCGGLNKLGLECVCSAPCEKKKRMLELASDRQF